MVLLLKKKDETIETTLCVLFERLLIIGLYLTIDEQIEDLAVLDLLKKTFTLIMDETMCTTILDSGFYFVIKMEKEIQRHQEVQKLQ